MAAAWNIPMFTTSGAFQSLNDKQIYKTLTRLSYSFIAIAEFYIKVFSHFNWTDVSVLYEREGTRFVKLIYTLNEAIGEDIHAAFQGAGLSSTIIPFSSESEQGFTNTLHKANASSRGRYSNHGFPTKYVMISS